MQHANSDLCDNSECTSRCQLGLKNGCWLCLLKVLLCKCRFTQMQCYGFHPAFGWAGANAQEAPAGNAKFHNALTMVLEHVDIDEQLRGESPAGGSPRLEVQPGESSSATTSAAAQKVHRTTRTSTGVVTSCCSRDSPACQMFLRIRAGVICC